MNENTEQNRINFSKLQEDLFQLSKPLTENSLKVNTHISLFKLAKCLEGINSAFYRLVATDKVKYVTKEYSIETKYNSTYSITYEKTQLIEQNLTSTCKAILTIKKPDFLSDISQWEFKFKDKYIHAKIIDNDWLAEFHNRKFSLLFGDSIECDMQIQTKNIKGAKQEVIYTITKVYQVISFPTPKQLKLQDNQ